MLECSQDGVCGVMLFTFIMTTMLTTSASSLFVADGPFVAHTKQTKQLLMSSSGSSTFVIIPGKRLPHFRQKQCIVALFGHHHQHHKFQPSQHATFIFLITFDHDDGVDAQVFREKRGGGKDGSGGGGTAGSKAPPGEGHRDRSRGEVGVLMLLVLSAVNHVSVVAASVINVSGGATLSVRGGVIGGGVDVGAIFVRVGAAVGRGGAVGGGSGSVSDTPSSFLRSLHYESRAAASRVPAIDVLLLADKCHLSLSFMSTIHRSRF